MVANHALRLHVVGLRSVLAVAADVQIGAAVHLGPLDAVVGEIGRWAVVDVRAK